MAENSNHNRYELRNRYVLTGNLVMQTAFHIGGGKATLSNSNSPVVLTPEGLPFIPGSSFKGALRSTIEKLVPGLPEYAGLRTCALIDLDDDELKEAQTDHLITCPTVRQHEITTKRREAQGDTKKENTITDGIFRDLCHTCTLFGSPFAAARININDLYVTSNEWGSIIQRRDGVAIDRDSEKARDGLKYDFEVVPASATFDLRITLENVTPQDLQLVSIGMSEFVQGFGIIGGKRSRGLGVCRLDNLHVSELALKDEDNTITNTMRSERLRAYLLNRKFSRELTGDEFLTTHITNIFDKEDDAKKK